MDFYSSVQLDFTINRKNSNIKNCLLYFVIFIVPFWLRKIGLPNNEPDFNLRLKDDAFKDYNRKREN
mgnify:CR=1 FL=1